jgi:8-oxo-dGTP pyrophosphatase MutT (NUDIX family)
MPLLLVRCRAVDPAGRFLSGRAGRLLVDRWAVRTPLMRTTLHLVGDRDCLFARPLLQPVPVLAASWTGPHVDLVCGVAATALGSIMMREAAVLVPVYRRQDGQLMVVLVRRAQGGAHGGQLALPGGRRAPGDADLAATALREADEEIGLAGDRVELLAALPVVETQTTGFRISPFLARLAVLAPWRCQEGEIAEVVEVRVGELARPEVQVEEVRAFPTWPAPRRVRLWRVGRHEVWGVTYRILEPLVPRLLGGEWPL